ncbi:MAG TPA: 6,7-dimethyl-8-ribityllumazine synthase [Steroidobacteraceae bacterium]|nr:6,7-dimethyl-8-ribityllumazine synthase [Steroidobacteraceae bacterium]
MSGAPPSDADFPAAGRRVAIVAARFNEVVVSALLQGAVSAWCRRGGEERDLFIARVPGAFELPVVARRLAASGRYEAIVALGCVIRGDTPHFEYVAGECARGLQQASCDTGVPIAFGVLTLENIEQARARAGADCGNKGAEAMASALEMAHLMARLPR